MARKRPDNRQRIRLSVPRAGPTAPLATFVESTDAACVQRWFHCAVCLRVYQAQQLISLGPLPDLSALTCGEAEAAVLRVTFHDDLASRLALAALRQMSAKARQIWLLEGALQLLELERRAEQGVDPLLFPSPTRATDLAVPRPPEPPQRRTPPPPSEQGAPVAPSWPATPEAPPAEAIDAKEEGRDEAGEDVVPIDDLPEGTLGALRGMVAGRRAS